MDLLAGARQRSETHPSIPKRHTKEHGRGESIRGRFRHTRNSKSNEKHTAIFFSSCLFWLYMSFHMAAAPATHSSLTNKAQPIIPRWLQKKKSSDMYVLRRLKSRVQEIVSPNSREAQKGTERSHERSRASEAREGKAVMWLVYFISISIH